MTKKEFLKKVAELRADKKNLIAMLKELWSTPKFKERVNAYAAIIPAKNADLIWTENTEDFEQVYSSLKLEYDHLLQISKRLSADFLESLSPVPASEPVVVSGEQKKPGKRGGARKDAGRKSIGDKRTVSIAMPYTRWSTIDMFIEAKVFKSLSEFFRAASAYYLDKGVHNDRPEYLDFIHDNPEEFKEFMETDLYKKLLEARRE